MSQPELAKTDPERLVTEAYKGLRTNHVPLDQAIPPWSNNFPRMK